MKTIFFHIVIIEFFVFLKNNVFTDNNGYAILPTVDEILL